MACVIAAPASGSGKTLLTLCLIAWARRQGRSIQPFKVGPDYLDPQLLSLSAGRVCRNLDLSLCGQEWVDLSFRGFGGLCDMAVVEGVMGLYDGIGASSEGSTAAVARHLNLPVVLVVDAGRQARSLAAVVLGFQSLEPRVHLAGVVLNRVSSQRHRELLQSVLDEINVPCLGSLPKDVSLCLPSRHLGLAPAHELGPIQDRISRWAALASSHLDLQRFGPLLKAPAAGANPIRTILAPVLDQQPVRTPIPVAVAQDEAFHFRYPEMQECLETMAMPVIPWSPLADEPPPPQAQGLVLPGGFQNCMQRRSANAAAASRPCSSGSPRNPSMPNAAACCCWVSHSVTGRESITPWLVCCPSAQNEERCRWATGRSLQPTTGCCCAQGKA